MSKGKKSLFSTYQKIAIIALFFFVAYLGGSGINWKEVYIRGKVSSANTDLRTIESALKKYKVDYGKFPVDLSLLDHDSSLQFTDLFHQDDEQSQYLYYANTQNFFLISRGPDGNFEHDYSPELIPELDFETLSYDPLNGTVSGGDIFRVGH